MTTLLVLSFTAAGFAPAWFLWRLMCRHLLSFQAVQIELLTQRLSSTETAFGVIHVYERNSNHATTCCGELLWRLGVGDRITVDQSEATCRR